MRNTIEEFASDLVERCDAVPAGNDKVTLEIGRDRGRFRFP